MKATFAAVLSLFVSPFLAACGSSSGGGAGGAGVTPVGTLTDTSGARFKPTKEPGAESVLPCDWQQGSKLQTDPSLKAGMRFVSEFNEKNGATERGGSTEAIIVGVQPQRLDIDFRILSLKGTAPSGVRVGAKFRQSCWVSGADANQQKLECEMTPKIPETPTSSESCYIQYDGTDGLKVEYVEGMYTMGDGRVIPVEMEKRTVKGTRECRDSSTAEPVPKGKGEEQVVVVRTKAFPENHFDICMNGAEVYRFSEERDESGAVTSSYKYETTSVTGL